MSNILWVMLGAMSLGNGEVLAENAQKEATQPPPIGGIPFGGETSEQLNKETEAPAANEAENKEKPNVQTTTTPTTTSSTPKSKNVTNQEIPSSTPTIIEPNAGKTGNVEKSKGNDEGIKEGVKKEGSEQDYIRGY